MILCHIDLPNPKYMTVDVNILQEFYLNIHTAATQTQVSCIVLIFFSNITSYFLLALHTRGLVKTYLIIFVLS